MKVVVQRVSSASVTIAEKIVAEIQYGLLVFVGIVPEDTLEDVDWLTGKIGNLRIFADADDVMNLSIKDCDGDIIVVSQFTLHASTKKGNRPSYIIAAKNIIAIPLYETFIKKLAEISGLSVKTGQFGADMKVSLNNDGPVTILMDTKNKE